MANIYYIDAYNVLHHAHALGPGFRGDIETARDALIERITRFCGVTGEQAKLVFDGQGRRAETVVPPSGAAGLEIVYAPAKQTADAFIERAVFQLENRRSVIVVSGDRGIRDLCAGMGALVISPKHFLATVREASDQVSASARQTLTGQSLGGVESRLDPEDLARLQALKDKLKPR